MIEWFTAAKCSVNEEDQIWIEETFVWLAEEIGEEIVLTYPVILPTEEYFPDVFLGREEDVPQMVARVCEYMEVEPDLVKLRFYEELRKLPCQTVAPYSNEQGGTAGYFATGRRKFEIGIEKSQLNNPTILIGTIAHELGHVILIGENRVSPDDDPDHEYLTDLLTVFYGLGIFTANSAMVFQQWTNTFSQGWQTQSTGYLTEEMYGYALAVYAWLRDERKPAWTQYLTTNVKSYLRSSLKFIEKNPELISVDLRNIKR